MGQRMIFDKDIEKSLLYLVIICQIYFLFFCSDVPSLTLQLQDFLNQPLFWVMSKAERDTLSWK